jgi:lipopolysaccharide exporter
VNWLKKPLEKFNQSEFIRNVVTLMSGTIIAQAIPVLMSPLLTRLFSPYDFGVFSIFTSIASVIAVIATLRFELSIVLPKEEKDAVNLLALSFYITLLITSISLIVIIVFHSFIIQWTDSPALQYLIYLIPIYVLFAGITQSLNYWYSRNRNFSLLSIGKIVQSGLNAVIALMGGVLLFKPGGLILGAIGGQFAGAAIYVFKFIQYQKSKIQLVEKAVIKKNFTTYKDFLIINTPHAFINTFQDLVIILLLNHFFSKEIVGLYALSYRILKLPVGLIGASSYQVFLQKSSTLHDDPLALHNLVKKILKQLTILAIPIFLVLIIAAPFLFKTVFGKEWEQAGVIARYISPWLLINFLTSPISAITLVVRKQGLAFIFSIIDFIIQSLVILLGAYLDLGLNTFLLLGIVSATYQLFILYWFYHISKPKQVDG